MSPTNETPARQEGETPRIPTPRTDEAWAAWPYAGSGVSVHFARTLERELSAKQAELDALTKRHTRTAKWLEITSNEKGDLIDAHDAALTELESLKAAQGWRAIETAPKDGTAIMVKLPDSDMPAIVRWDSALQMAYDPTWVICWDGEHVGKTSKPTHWMPLPDPHLESEPKCSECEEEISADGDGHNSRCIRLHMPPEGLEIPTPPVERSENKG